MFCWALWSINYGICGHNCDFMFLGRGVCEREALVLSGGQWWSLSLLCSSEEARGRGAAVATAPGTPGTTGGHHQLQPQSAHCSQGKALENCYNGSCWFLLMSPFNLENRACSFSIFTVNLILMRKVHSWFDFNEEDGLWYLKPICSILTVLLSITYSDSDPYFRHFLIYKNMTLYIDKGFSAENRSFRAKFCNALCLWIIFTYV